MVNPGKTSATEAARLSGLHRSSILGFSVLRVRYGIKLSLASLLSLYVALVLRLEHPNWAVLTTLVMMNSHYVGSTALKSNATVRRDDRRSTPWGLARRHVRLQSGFFPCLAVHHFGDCRLQVRSVSG